MDFYSSLAPDYDTMTRFTERLVPEETLLKKWIDPSKVKTVFDAACGTGLHAIILAKMGLNVTGADLSKDMINQARAHADALGVKVTWQTADMRRLYKTPARKFDAVLCLGNSLPHLLTGKELDSAIKGFFGLLNPGGFLLLQLLNYDRILKNKERIVGINKKEGKTFIRFYDFTAPCVNFNVLTLSENQGKSGHALISTPLYPYRKNELAQALKQRGFRNIQYAGNLEGIAFDRKSSGNLVIQAFA